MRKRLWAQERVILALVFVAVGYSAMAQDTSTPEERTEWAQVTHRLESNPLDEKINQDGERVFHRVMDAHDIHVPLCASFFHEFNAMKYTFSHAIVRQFMLASAAFVVENPDKIADGKAMNLAAVESVLKFYNSIQQQKPAARSKMLDDLLKKQSQGKLDDAVRKKCASQ